MGVQTDGFSGGGVETSRLEHESVDTWILAQLG